jgi:hypothetical protein
MNRLLALHNISSIDEMMNKLQQVMTPADWSSYQRLIADIRGKNAMVDNILTATNCVAFVSGTLASSINRSAVLYKIVSTGAFTASTELLTRGFVMMIRGKRLIFTLGGSYLHIFPELGKEGWRAMMAAAIEAGRRLAAVPGISAGVKKFVRVLRAVAAVATDLRFVLDSIVIVIAAIEGARQREQLQR